LLSAEGCHNSQSQSNDHIITSVVNPFDRIGYPYKDAQQ